MFILGNSPFLIPARRGVKVEASKKGFFGLFEITPLFGVFRSRRILGSHAHFIGPPRQARRHLSYRIAGKSEAGIRPIADPTLREGN